MTQAKNHDDLLCTLGDISKDSVHKQLYRYYDETAKKFLPHDESHPFVLNLKEEEKEKHFIFGFDEVGLIFAITAKNADYYGILSTLQDKMNDSSLAANSVHVVSQEDENKFPSFQRYFSECNRLGLSNQTIVFDLKENLTVLSHIESRTAPRDSIKSFASLMRTYLRGDTYKKYAGDLGKKNSYQLC